MGNLQRLLLLLLQYVFIVITSFYRETQPGYNFEVTSRDHGQPAKTATTFVTVRIYSYNLEVTSRDHGQSAKTATTFVTVCIYSLYN